MQSRPKPPAGAVTVHIASHPANSAPAARRIVSVHVVAYAATSAPAGRGNVTVHVVAYPATSAPAGRRVSPCTSSPAELTRGR
jgi:hypothetical protein